jgi:hypothetical protein
VAGTVEDDWLMPGKVIDRYGPQNGRFVSPDGTPKFARGLYPEAKYDIYYRYKVVKPIPVTKSEIAKLPVLNTGGGIQYKLPVDINTLLKHGIIVHYP